jgi:hypothetical protein
MAYTPATEAVKRPDAGVNVIPDETFSVPVAFIKASVDARDDDESVVRVKLMY